MRTVTLEADGAWVETVVADDGAGLPDPAVPATGAGFGLRFMHDRVRRRRGHPGDDPLAAPEDTVHGRPDGRREPRGRVMPWASCSWT